MPRTLPLALVLSLSALGTASAAPNRTGRELSPLLDDARHAKAYRGLKKQLRATRISVDYRRGLALPDVLADLRKRTKLRLHLLRKAQPALAKTTIRLRLKQVRLSSLLELIAVQCGEGVRYGYRHGVLWFGLVPEQHTQPVVLRFYESATANYRAPDPPERPQLRIQVKPQRAAERARAKAKPRVEDSCGDADCTGCCECTGHP